MELIRCSYPSVWPTSYGEISLDAVAVLELVCRANRCCVLFFFCSYTLYLLICLCPFFSISTPVLFLSRLFRCLNTNELSIVKLKKTMMKYN